MALDEERAPLIKLAFEEYTTGNWAVSDLAEHLALCGLTTRATPRMPSVPINAKAMNKILVNPYNKGLVTYKGVEYAGSHPALVDELTWRQVQESSPPTSMANGEHPHVLKGSLYCRNCGARMIINYTKSHSGMRYPYSVRVGRHNKVAECGQKTVLIDNIERKVEQIYDQYSCSPAVREYLEKFLQDSVKTERQKYETELDGLRREKDKLEHQRKKLLEVHYNDAIPLDLMKSEQQKIAKQLAAIENALKPMSVPLRVSQNGYLKHWN